MKAKMNTNIKQTWKKHEDEHEVEQTNMNTDTETVIEMIQTRTQTFDEDTDMEVDINIDYVYVHVYVLREFCRVTVNFLDLNCLTIFPRLFQWTTYTSIFA